MRNSKIVNICLVVAAILLYGVCVGQQKHTVQVKVFDQQLSPFRNTEVSINKRPYLVIGSKGSGFIELEESDFPVKSVVIKNSQYEAASWNFSKGTLEVIVRKKNYQLIDVFVVDETGLPISNFAFQFKGMKPSSLKSDSEGHVEVQVGLNEQVVKELFDAATYTVVNLENDGNKFTLTLSAPVSAQISESEQVDGSKSSKDLFKNFDFSMLDSIQSLTVFYSLFKNTSMKDLDAKTRKRIDRKFNALVKQLQDSIRRRETTFIGKISDSSFVNDDINNMVQQAQTESEMLESQRNDFDEKIRMITEKLEAGLTNLDEESRKKLMLDLTILQNVLVENENKFFKNQEYYRSIINSLKRDYLDTQELEDKLTESERQRQEQKEQFQQRLLITLGIALLFALLVILLVTFSNALRRQKKALEVANGEVKRINENLEALVYQRTQLLAEANKELDTFLYRASHDLRSPVCSIVGLCNLASHVANPESKELLGRIESITNQMDRLLKKLSSISEINHPTNYSEVRLSDLLDRMLLPYRIMHQDKLDIRLECKSDALFFTYPNLVGVIVSNLVENSIFYSTLGTGRKPVVVVQAEHNDQGISITVWDNGIGIDKSIQPRLYDMFFKGNEYSRGNGLGLYIVLKSLLALNGEITLNTVPGAFTEFRVFFPTSNATVLNVGEPAEATLV